MLREDTQERVFNLYFARYLARLFVLQSPSIEAPQLTPRFVISFFKDEGEVASCHISEFDWSATHSHGVEARTPAPRWKG